MLEAGIDHVIMHLSFTPYSTPAITAIQELAAAHGLVIWDPQSDDAYLPALRLTMPIDVRTSPPAPGTLTPNRTVVIVVGS